VLKTFGFELIRHFGEIAESIVLRDCESEPSYGIP
jgi:hypothetical protein